MSKLRFLYIHLLISILSCGVVTSCRDDIPFNGGEFGEGVGELSAEIVFSPVVQNINKSRSAGDLIREVNSLCVLIYKKSETPNENGEYGYVLDRRVWGEDLLNYKIENDGNSETAGDALPDDAHQAEEKTPKATFTIRDIEYGQYQIYAVANMGHLEKYSNEDINTPEQLKSITLIWDNTDIGKNNQMFGYFTLESNQTSTGFDAPMITVKSVRTSIHAWLKRAASKVTVAVDGSELYDDVQVWIKSIQVKDIPDMCWLGKDNTAPAHLIENGERIIVSPNDNQADGEDANNLVTNHLNYPRNMEDAHMEKADALFFYENMQGTGQLKTQVWPDQGPNPDKPKFPDGNDPRSQGYKDSKIAGTYVEVIGYYKNSEGEGPIIYRFMLGKNETDNYDAQRNYHFKLTLKLKHNANDNDWHIVYNQEPEILAHEPYYISYLYNQSMSYPIKIVGGELISLRAEIPDDEVTKMSWAPKNGEVTAEDEAAAKALGGNVYWTGNIDNPGPWNGFLSLRKPTETRFGVWPDYNEAGEKIETYNPDASLTYTYNETHYKELNCGQRAYLVSEGYHTDPDGDYQIIKTAPGEYEASIPLFTRPLVMVSQTGYTGNNPYVAYNRESKIKVIAEIKKPNGEIVTKERFLTIIQSRRVLNPKAIWRSEDKTTPFHVQLKILPSQTASSFENLLSDGSWIAEVIVGQEWIEILPTANASQYNPDKTISGIGDPYAKDNIAGRTIDFTIKPKSTTTVPRGGIVRVLYNNLTCVHTIFVRQGYEPISFDGNTYWHTFNLETGGYNNTEAKEVAKPELEGSYFRKFNRQYPIAASSNTLSWFDKNGMDRQFDIAGQSATRKWSEITPPGNSWGTFKVNGKVCRIPKSEDFAAIINNPNIVYGYGILYGDECTAPIEGVQDAYGANSTGGMLGVIICNETDGMQLFFPIAASGYGRFKQWTSIDRYNRQRAGWGGVEQYANRYTWYPVATSGYNGVQYKPLFYDIWKNEGTNYWLENDRGLDINFTSVNFATDTQSDLGLIWADWAGGADPSGTDAIHIRLVHDAQ